MKLHISAYHICWAIIAPKSEKGFPKYFAKTLIKNGFLSVGNEAFFARSYNNTNPKSVLAMNEDFAKIEIKLSNYKTKIKCETVVVTDRQFGLIGTSDFAQFSCRIKTKIGYIPVTCAQYNFLH